MFFSWVRRMRRERLLAEPFPATWQRYLEANVPHYRRLETDDQRRLRDGARLLIAEKNWEGCGGLALTDEIQVTIAALASLLILHKSIDSYRRVMSVLVYPGPYVAAESQFPRSEPLETEPRDGESWHGGSVIVNWAETLENLREASGTNLVLHEFAHQLDFVDWASDGTPPLADREQAAAWRRVMAREYQRLLDDAETGRPTTLDKYGTKNEAEFFAVATEAFFERARLLQRQHPELYGILAEYYQQDPANWRE